MSAAARAKWSGPAKRSRKVRLRSALVAISPRVPCAVLARRQRAPLTLSRASRQGDDDFVVSDDDDGTGGGAGGKADKGAAKKKRAPQPFVDAVIAELSAKRKLTVGTYNGAVTIGIREARTPPNACVRLTLALTPLRLSFTRRMASSSPAPRASR
jgi:hypothetical protein